MQNYRVRLIQHTLIGIIVLFTIVPVLAQSTKTNELLPYPQQRLGQSLDPKIDSSSGLDLPVRRMERTGTAINGARSSVSIKSTDAGIVHFPPAVSPHTQYAPEAMYGAPPSNCINCSIIDFSYLINQETMLNAITSGIIAGTIIRKIDGQNNALPLNNHNGNDTVRRGRQP